MLLSLLHDGVARGDARRHTEANARELLRLLLPRTNIEDAVSDGAVLASEGTVGKDGLLDEEVRSLLGGSTQRHPSQRHEGDRCQNSCLLQERKRIKVGEKEHTQHKG